MHTRKIVWCAKIYTLLNHFSGSMSVALVNISKLLTSKM